MMSLAGPSEQRVHPGHDSFFVIEGRLHLSLGQREVTVETGDRRGRHDDTRHRSFGAGELVDGEAVAPVGDEDSTRAVRDLQLMELDARGRHRVVVAAKSSTRSDEDRGVAAEVACEQHEGLE
jgi:hypothetical protein